MTLCTAARNNPVVLMLNHCRRFFNQEIRRLPTRFPAILPPKDIPSINTNYTFLINHFSFGTNATLSIPALEDIGFGVNLKLPQPQADIHSVNGKLRYTKGFTYVAHTLKYTSQVGGANYGTSGEVIITKSFTLQSTKFLNIFLLR